jgi:hypothetical protein
MSAGFALALVIVDFRPRIGVARSERIHGRTFRLLAALAFDLAQLTACRQR